MANKQENIKIDGSGHKVIGNDDNSITINNIGKKGKLSHLFKKLKEKFDNSESITMISEDLKRYTDNRDTIGLKDKLINAGKDHLYDDFAWLKQEFHKKLVKYQYYEPAQEIFSYILAIILERYRNIVKPKISNGESEQEILKTISMDIIDPIISLIQTEGCNDIMGLSSTEIEGMFHYLTGNCHIKWQI